MFQMPHNDQAERPGKTAKRAFWSALSLGCAARLDPRHHRRLEQRQAPQTPPPASPPRPAPNRMATPPLPVEPARAPKPEHRYADRRRPGQPAPRDTPPRRARRAQEVLCLQEDGPSSPIQSGGSGHDAERRRTGKRSQAYPRRRQQVKLDDRKISAESRGQRAVGNPADPSHQPKGGATRSRRRRAHHVEAFWRPKLVSQCPPRGRIWLLGCGPDG
jgi:hypothetical protein